MRRETGAIARAFFFCGDDGKVFLVLGCVPVIIETKVEMVLVFFGGRRMGWGASRDTTHVAGRRAGRSASVQVGNSRAIVGP